MKNRDYLLCEDVWGSEDVSNPFEIKVESGHCGEYGSYLSGLPVYHDPELQQQYSYLKEFAKWAIENKVCNSCRLPWVGYEKACECGKYEINKEHINGAEKAAMDIIDFDRKKVVGWAKQMEVDLQGDSEYAQLNRKARGIMQKRIDRYNREKQSINLLDKIIQKKTWVNLFRRITKWFRPSYLSWRFKTPKSERDKSIPLYAATDDIVKNMSFGNKKVQDGNCCIRTKGGCVVIVPANMVDELRDNYKGGEIVAPAIKS